ncbi:MAG: hypothetical protein O3B47_01190, partial [bacterium]|nr:hypothetical protein [bacterium]
MKRQCKQCKEEFEITDDDLEFYEKVSPVIGGRKFSIPSPTLCPDCRCQRRLVWRNERALYKRKCDLTGASFISWIAPDKPYKAYKNEAWWGDKWNVLDYGRDFDFSRPFFEQFDELLVEVPWMGILIDKTENSDYVNFCNNVKNCYLIYGSNNNEDCMYSTYLTNCSDCLDLLHGDGCSLCYDCIDTTDCYNCKHCLRCTNSSDLIMCENCQNCRNCFGCVNLVGKDYCFFNELLGKEGYEEKMKEIDTGSYEVLIDQFTRFYEHRLKFPKRLNTNLNCENCTGDGIRDSKNVFESYDVIGAEDCKWIMLSHGGVKDCQDCFGIEENELCYQTVANGVPSTNTSFAVYAWKGVHDSYYLVLSPGSQNCFACMGLNKGKYCILNKQYSKKEYEEMVPRIIEHMQKTGEWGEFLPGSISPFAYNETMAQDYFPLSEDEALEKGFKWVNDRDELDVEGAISVNELPDNIRDVGDGILEKIIKCEATGKPFKINAQELGFYKRHDIPLPRKHSDRRHLERMALRNPQKLWDRKCDK